MRVFELIALALCFVSVVFAVPTFLVGEKKPEQIRAHLEKLSKQIRAQAAKIPDAVLLEEAVSLGESNPNFFEPNVVSPQSSYRANSIVYRDVNSINLDDKEGCDTPPCMVPAVIEGPLPPRLAPRADLTFNHRPMMISREDGKPGLQEKIDRAIGDTQ